MTNTIIRCLSSSQTLICRRRFGRSGFFGLVRTMASSHKPRFQVGRRGTRGLRTMSESSPLENFSRPEAPTSVKKNAGGVLAAGFAILVLGACFQEGTAAWACSLANQRTMESLDRACRLMPLNAVFWRERGIVRLDSSPSAADQFLKRSIELNAYEADSLIGLGLLAESKGHLNEAEDYLIRAASQSRRFKPKWALAFFYFRLGKFDRFWPAASAAANVEGSDAKPVFRLSLQVLPDAEQVTELLHLQNQHALTGYIGFLLERKGFAALSRVALRIQPDPDCRALLLAVVERLIDEGQPEQAVQLWNHLNTDRGIRPLSPATGTSLTNGLFATGEGRGFEWRHADNQGIQLREGVPGDLRIEFSGRQAESSTLLEQFVPVLPGRAYRLSFHYATDGLSGLTGLYWQVFQGNIPLAPPSTPIISVPEGSGYLPFRTASGSGLIRLALRYNRAPGTTRLEGALTLRSAALDLL